MAIRNYVGARYVPKFADPLEWQANTSYEAMVIVTYNNASYTSKVPVPPTVGNPAENSKYWALTGNYNAQVEEYRKATAEAQEHARDGICAIDEGNNTTATKSHKAHEYFWWKGKLYRAKEDINAGALLSDGGNVEEGNVADGVSVNSTDINTLKPDVSNNSNMINMLNDNINSNSRRIVTLEKNDGTNTNDISALKTKTDINTNDISGLKTKTETNTNDISGLKTKDTQFETELDNFAQNVIMKINSYIQYKVYTSKRDRGTGRTTSANTWYFSQTISQFIETVPSGVTLIPIHIQYHYFDTTEAYNDSANKGKTLTRSITTIDPQQKVGSSNTMYSVFTQSSEQWTEVGYYYTIGVLEIKTM